MPRILEIFPGIRIDDPSVRGSLIYDGDCGFCQRSVNLAKRIAGPGLKTVSRRKAVLPESVQATTAGQIVWVAPDGRVFGGSRALAAMLRHTGHPVLSMLWRLPGARLLYRFIAQNRHRFGRPAVCELEP